MKIISTKLHGYLDYIVGILLAASPWLLGFASDNNATRIPLYLGIAAVLYSLFTEYEMGVFKIIPMPMHLTLDLLSGLFLAVSPWIFGFNSTIWTPHVVIGCLEIAVVLMTNHKLEQTKSEAEAIRNKAS